MWFCLKMHYGIILVIQGHLRVRKVIYKVKNKIAARYFKVKYDFSTNEARNKCNTSFSCNFDWAIRFLYYFYDSRSSLRSKSLFQGHISKNTSFNNNAKNMCNTFFSWDFVSKIYLWYYFGDPRSSSRSKGHFQFPMQHPHQCGCSTRTGAGAALAQLLSGGTRVRHWQSARKL